VKRIASAVDSPAKWTWVALMVARPAGQHSLEIVTLNAGLPLGGVCLAGTMA
jgi:hypothetical protein